MNEQCLDENYQFTLRNNNVINENEVAFVANKVLEYDTRSSIVPKDPDGVVQIIAIYHIYCITAIKKGQYITALEVCIICCILGLLQQKLFFVAQQ